MSASACGQLHSSQTRLPGNDCVRMYAHARVRVCVCVRVEPLSLHCCLCVVRLCCALWLLPQSTSIRKEVVGERRRRILSFLYQCVCVCVLRCVWACTWLQVFPLLLHNIRTWQKPTPYSTFIEKHRGSNITHQRRAVITVWKQSLEKNTNHHIHEGNLK